MLLTLHTFNMCLCGSVLKERETWQIIYWTHCIKHNKASCLQIQIPTSENVPCFQQWLCLDTKICQDMPSLHSKVKYFNISSNISHQILPGQNDLSCYPNDFWFTIHYKTKLILKWNIKMYYETATSEQYIFLWPTLAQVISGKIPQIVQMWIAQGIQKKCVFMCVSKVLSTLKIIY